jgi:hypothetical protein
VGSPISPLALSDADMPSCDNALRWIVLGPVRQLTVFPRRHDAALALRTDWNMRTLVSAARQTLHSIAAVSCAPSLMDEKYPFVYMGVAMTSIVQCKYPVGFFLPLPLPPPPSPILLPQDLIVDTYFHHDFLRASSSRMTPSSIPFSKQIPPEPSSANMFSFRRISPSRLPFLNCAK